jgi:RHS repeat-associated protein
MGYDAGSNRTSFTAPDNSTVSYGYDTLNRLTNLTDSLTGQFTFGYDILSRRTSLNRPNGVNTSYSYDSLSRLLSVLHQAGTVTLDGATYGYDNAGNRASKTNDLNNVTENYTYDPVYQLTQVTQGLTTSESYSYDAVGNRLSSQGMSPYAYNSSNQLTSTPSATFTYDGDGNTSIKADASGTTTYNWDFENRLISVLLPGTGGTVTFKYDPFGRRVQKSSSSGTTNYVYDGSNSVEELDQAGTELAHYAQGAGIDEPLAASRGGATGFYEQDGLGSVTSLTDSTGVLLNSYTYDSFGNPTALTSSVVNPYQFTGREYDLEIGLQYYRARYYDPTSGRFLSGDPIRFDGGINFYDYVKNNPLIRVDPTGLAQCVYTVRLGWLSCVPDQGGRPLLDIPVASGNNGGGTSCKNNPKCQRIHNRGPIPGGWWRWTTDSTTKPNGRVLKPFNGTNTFGRDLFRTHSCINAFGPSKNAPFCSAGCITGTAADMKKLNDLLDKEPGSTLYVDDSVDFGIPDNP